MDGMKMEKQKTKIFETSVFKVTVQLETFLVSFLMSPAMSQLCLLDLECRKILEMIWTMTVSVRHTGWVGWLVAVNGSCFTGRLFLRRSPTIPWFPD